MANTFQKLIYNFSVASPLLIVFSFVWFIQKQTWIVSLICIFVAIVLIILELCSFSYGKKHLAPIKIRTNSITPRDSWVMIYIISYMLPFSSFVIASFNILVIGAVCLATVVVAAYAIDAIPNPILLLKKYHFYSLGAENGISGYILLSKRKLRKKQDIKTVRRMFDFLLLDVEE